jgi:hypothetical protein
VHAPRHYWIDSSKCAPTPEMAAATVQEMEKTIDAEDTDFEFSFQSHANYSRSVKGRIGVSRGTIGA